jgi:uncharacterized protein YecE (DUF72 family)
VKRQLPKSAESPRGGEAPNALVPAHARIGISGWTYPPWRGVFYPVGVKQREELAFASRIFSTIEINGSFYALMRPTSYAAWHSATPVDFVFSVKGGRFITHFKRLREAQTALANFFASGLLCLGEKLGPVLWQLPPRLHFEPDVLRGFLELLPRDLREVERLARLHDGRVAGRATLEASCANRPLRHVLEVRHQSFLEPRFIELMRQQQVAVCVADTAGLYPLIDEGTTDFMYARLHGSQRLYVSGYDAGELEHWAARIRKWQRLGRDVYVYFDNDVKVRAPFDALNLQRLLRGLPAVEPPAAIATVTEEPRTGWVGWAPPTRRRA